MTTFICFIIAMVFLYIMKLATGGFDFIEFVSFLLMIILLGGHVYLSTREKAIWGAVVPVVIVASFLLVYKLMKPDGRTLIALVLLYVIALVCCLFIWYRARKTKD